MASSEEAIQAEKTEIIWMLERDSSSIAGTASSCQSFMNARGSDQGICIGDAETQPVAGVFDSASFSHGRGFDMIVRRSDMKIIWTASHGSPAGNDNLSGPEILAVIQAL